jgi:hypothetical protein
MKYSTPSYVTNGGSPAAICGLTFIACQSLIEELVKAGHKSFNGVDVDIHIRICEKDDQLVQVTGEAVML